ncbi:MAG: hypothetical protein ACTJLL_02570 [Anaplasma sp.]
MSEPSVAPRQEQVEVEFLSEPCDSKARFLSGNAEALFHTEKPTSTDGAARILAQRYESAVGAKPGIDVIVKELRKKLEGCDKVHDNVLRAWVAFYTPPEKRKKLLKTVEICIAYPTSPGIEAYESSINISPITRKSGNNRLFTAGNQDFGIRCVETIVFKIKDNDIGTKFEDVQMHVHYDIFGMQGHQSVEMCNFGFKVFPHCRYLARGGCKWKHPGNYKRVFAFKELELMALASEHEDMFLGGGSEERRGKGNIESQKRTLTGRFSYAKLLQQHMDVDAMQAKWDASSAIGKRSLTSGGIVLRGVDFFKDKQAFCENVFGLSDDQLLCTLSNAVISKEGNPLQRGVRLESRQKMSIKMPDDVHRERYKVIEHASVRAPLSPNSLHIMLSYEMARYPENAKGAQSHKGVEIFNAKLGVRSVHMGFTLHKCAWSYYRSTDFVTFLIPNFVCNLDYNFLDCWNSAVESDISEKSFPVVKTITFPWGSEEIAISTNVPGSESANAAEDAPVWGAEEVLRADSAHRLEEQKRFSELRELSSKAWQQWLDDSVRYLNSDILKKNMLDKKLPEHEVAKQRAESLKKASNRGREQKKLAKGKETTMPEDLGFWGSILYFIKSIIKRTLLFIFGPFIKLGQWAEGLANKRLECREKERAEAKRLAAERAESKKKGRFFSKIKRRFGRGGRRDDPVANKNSADNNKVFDLAQEDSAKDRKDQSAEDKDNLEATTTAKKSLFKRGKDKNKDKKATSGEYAFQQSEGKVAPNAVVLKADEREEKPLRPPPGYCDDDSNNRKKRGQEADHPQLNGVSVAASNGQKSADVQVIDAKPANFGGNGSNHVATTLHDVVTEAQKPVQQEK